MLKSENMFYKSSQNNKAVTFLKEKNVVADLGKDNDGSGMQER